MYDGLLTVRLKALNFIQGICKDACNNYQAEGLALLKCAILHQSRLVDSYALVVFFHCGAAKPGLKHTVRDQS